MIYHLLYLKLHMHIALNKNILRTYQNLVRSAFGVRFGATTKVSKS